MSSSTSRGCRLMSHHGDAAARMVIYNNLSPEIRDQFKIARNDFCAGSIRNKLRPNGLERVLKDFDQAPRREREKRAPEVRYVLREDLRP